MYSTRVGDVSLEFVQGDITEFTADAIVNAANNHLWMGGGVAGAIKRKGGAEIEREAVSKGPIPVGEAVATTAGRLPARWVIHAAGMGQDLRTDEGKIRTCTQASLRVADEVGAAHVAFPAIGTGVGGFSVRRAGEVMGRAVIDYLHSLESSGGKISRLSKVSFVLLDTAALEDFWAGASAVLGG